MAKYTDKQLQPGANRLFIKFGDMGITPKHRKTDFKSWPPSINDKITIFFDQTDGWQLAIADQCINGIKGPDGEILTKPIPHSGFAVLHIAFSYFEKIGKYQDGYRGEGKSKDYFKKGVYSVFGPELKEIPSSAADALLNTLYSDLRCVLYHVGIVDQRILLTGETDEPMLLVLDGSRSKLIIINPYRFIPRLRIHLKDYVEQLRDINNFRLRKNFERRFDFDAS